TTLDFIQTEEGRIVNNGGAYKYEYNLSDHLGNVRYSFDSYNGSVRQLQRDDYYPFGLRIARLAGTVANKYLYNGKEIQDELNQYDYEARFYDPVIGRFTTIDPLADEFENVSPYNYALNNPILMIDPTGMAADSAKVNTPKPAPKPIELKEVVITAKKTDNSGARAAAMMALTAIQYDVATPDPSDGFWPKWVGEAIVGTAAAVTLYVTAPDIKPVIVKYTPPPKSLKGFPKARPAKPIGNRKRWKDSDGKILEWDSQHGEVEVYDRSGKNHKGGFDPETGKQISEPKPGRTTPVN
ncbi:colicin E3/pyocin S6 family cytotoxin, partial [Arcticibacter sp.]|uniref:colicin E3/pyocin S6 family cytotoxin n=1 Tax=Arcticibacter sp. TaxID=1872630 RepID=UPI003890CE36